MASGGGDGEAVLIGFRDHTRIGMPLTLAALAFGNWWLGR